MKTTGNGQKELVNKLRSSAYCASSSDEVSFNYSQPSEISLSTEEFGDEGESNLYRE